jgi:NADH-quinone oxidoreductase subunit N
MIAPVFLEIAVVILGIFLLLFEAFANEKDKTFIAWLAVSGLGLIFVLSFFTSAGSATASGTAAYWTFYKADPLALFFKRFALITTIVVLIMSIDYRDVFAKYVFGATPQAGLGEFYSLPVFTCAGLMWMASAVDFTLIFVSLELVTISFYVLVSCMRRHNGALEAGVKYLILSALSTGFLVYGITWIFGVTGETNLDRLEAIIPTLSGMEVPLLFGFMLVMVALGFKIAAVPFQLWVPDVYQGAPTPITAFLSVGSKAAGFVVLMRVLEPFLAATSLSPKIVTFLIVIAALTLIYGNLAAMPQSNLKRLLAYSSIAHAGYLLVAAASVGAESAGIAIAFYLVAYLLMTLLSFMIVVVVAAQGEGDDLRHFNGLNERSPFLSFAMLIAMLSLAGVPLTAGFFGKFLVFEAAMQEQQYVLVAIGIVTVAAGFYYYLKVVRAMYWQPAPDNAPLIVTPVTKTTIAALTALIVLLGVNPHPVLKMLKTPAGTRVALSGR